MNAKEQQLSDFLEALRPIIYIDDFDFHAVDELIRNAAKGEKIIELVMQLTQPTQHLVRLCR